MYSVLRMFLPVVRSRTKNQPLRAACASSLRGLPSTSPSKSTGVCVASQSCVSCGDDWKYQASFPVSGLSATIDSVNRLSPCRLRPLITGCGLPVPK